MDGDGRTTLEGFALDALRIVAAFLYWAHGAQKLFGILGGHRFPYASLLGVAGFIEFFGGALLFLGLFTRPVAFVVAGEMAAAYFIAHFPRAETLMGHVFPIVNGGELPVLFCFIFLAVFAFGPGKLSVDGWLRARAVGRTDAEARVASGGAASSRPEAGAA